jgi:signal transduction histidine kinase
MAEPTDPEADGTSARSAIAERVRALPEPTQRLLQLAAGLGPAFELASLAAVADRSPASVVADLQPSLAAGLIALDFASRAPRLIPSPSDDTEAASFAFIAPVDVVYGLVPGGELPALHLRIGRLLLAHEGDRPVALEHLGRGARLLEIAHDEAQRQLGLQQRLASLGTLFAGVAHEIKNPLNFINNFAELSVTLTADLAADLAQIRDRLDARSTAHLDEIMADLVQNVSRIRAHGGRADAIVRGMLEHARGRAGQACESDFNALVQAYARAAAQGRDDADCPALELSLDPAVGCVRVVPEEIGRVVLNLVSNALYAAEAQRTALDGPHPSGSVRGEGFTPAVLVSTHHRGDAVEVRVRDNGVGIPAALRGNVFTPFFTTKPAGVGTGLGLSLSREIVVQGHGGTISFESEDGDGAHTEFVVTLPRR